MMMVNTLSQFICSVIFHGFTQTDVKSECVCVFFFLGVLSVELYDQILEVCFIHTQLSLLSLLFILCTNETTVLFFDN